MSKKYKPLEYFEEMGFSRKEYYEQFETPKTIEVGKIYRQPNLLYWSDYKIIYAGEGVALGVEVANGNDNYKIGGMELFYWGGIRHGFRYKSDLAHLRLQKLIKVEEEKDHE